MTGKDGHRYRVPTLQIREDVLTEVAAMLIPIECDWPAVIKTVREQQPDYLAGKSKMFACRLTGKADSVQRWYCLLKSCHGCQKGRGIFCWS